MALVLAAKFLGGGRVIAGSGAITHLSQLDCREQL
jgi:hypothetical protein